MLGGLVRDGGQTLEEIWLCTVAINLAHAHPARFELWGITEVSLVDLNAKIGISGH